MSAENHGDNHGLVVQPHGGALRLGGPNKGGTGRPSNKARELARLAVEESIPLMADMVKGKGTGEVYPSQQIQAFKVLADIGLPKEVIQTVLTQDAMTLLECVAIAAADYLEEHELEAFLGRVEELTRGRMGGSERDSEAGVPEHEVSG